VSTDGSSRESTDTSDTNKESSTPAAESHVNSPARINPKKPKQQAAHSILLSRVQGSADHTVYNACRIAGVIGSRGRRKQSGFTRRTPLRTYVSRLKDWKEGSGRPARIWQKRKALR